MIRLLLLLAFTLVAAPCVPAADPTAADQRLDAYFRAESEKLAAKCLADVHTLDDWNAKRAEYRGQLQEMLGLKPWPARGDLKPVITGRIERDDFVVERLHFQSMPGLYVTANFYLPKPLPATPAPAILYACGHARVVENNVILGNKTGYQHHGEWFARHGYACLVIDTVQLGEIEGTHHGTYRMGRWWWNSRGYTPAGVEAWNCIRALDYLETRPEVEAKRIGMTGRSGGGSYTWTTAALDDRVKAAAPVAGITDLQNQVVDGAVDGHCDCMFFVNKYRWDFPLVAALVVPRPLLIVNTDTDNIFPFDGVIRLHEKVRRIYELHGASKSLGLVIGPGPHKDTQDLQIPVFRFFNQHLRGEDPLIARPAEKLLAPAELRVFGELPKDEINTRIDETFVPTANGDVPADVLEKLRAESFRGWPAENAPLRETARSFDSSGRVFASMREIETQPGVSLRYVTSGSLDANAEAVVLTILGEGETDDGGKLTAKFPVRVSFAARGIGSDKWTGDAKRQTQIRRRFMLLGQTLDGMRVWDIRRAIQCARKNHPGALLHIRASGAMAVNALFASLFEPAPAALEFSTFPASPDAAPDYLGARKVLDLQQALALAKKRGFVAVE